MLVEDPGLLVAFEVDTTERQPLCRSVSDGRCRRPGIGSRVFMVGRCDRRLTVSAYPILHIFCLCYVVHLWRSVATICLLLIG